MNQPQRTARANRLLDALYAKPELWVDRGMTQQEIAEYIGLTRAAVGKIEAKALEKLRRLEDPRGEATHDESDHTVHHRSWRDELHASELRYW